MEQEGNTLSGLEKVRNSKKTVIKLLYLIIRPPTNIIDQRDRQRYRFILGFTLLACPVLVFAEMASGILLNGIPVFYVMSLLLFMSIIICWSGHLNLAIAIDLLSFSLFPYIVLILKETWSIEYSFIVVMWIPITMLIGSYLLNQRETTLFIVTHAVVFLVLILIHPGASLFRSAPLESVLPLFVISFLIFVGSWTRQRHIDQLDKLNNEMDSKNKELNIYTSLLIHDIGNDLQLCFLNTEATSLFLDLDLASAKEHISVALTVQARMDALLKIFSKSQVIVESDIVSLIELVADEAKIAHENLEIIITADEQCRNYGIASRFLPMVFANLFRNSAAHAGTTPVVKVSITLNEQNVSIIVNDNGPGIDPSIHNTLFEKGVTGTQSTGTGMGLYLIKQIVEMHDGTISLMDMNESGGCSFHINLPCDPLI